MIVVDTHVWLWLLAPVDRIIYATARAHDAPLVTKDAALRAYDPRGTRW